MKKKLVAYTDGTYFYTPMQYKSFKDEERVKMRPLYEHIKPVKKPEPPKIDIAVLGALCRGGRAMLKLSQQELADRSKLSKAPIIKIENEKHIPHNNTVGKLIQAFRESGLLIGLDKRTNELSLRQVIQAPRQAAK